MRISDLAGVFSGEEDTASDVNYPLKDVTLSRPMLEWHSESGRFVEMKLDKAMREQHKLNIALAAIESSITELVGQHNFRLDTVSSVTDIQLHIALNDWSVREYTDYLLHEISKYYPAVHRMPAVTVGTDLSSVFTSRPLNGIARPYNLAWNVDKTLFVNMEQEPHMHMRNIDWLYKGKSWSKWNVSTVDSGFSNFKLQLII